MLPTIGKKISKRLVIGETFSNNISLNVLVGLTFFVNLFNPFLIICTLTNIQQTMHEMNAYKAYNILWLYNYNIC